MFMRLVGYRGMLKVPSSRLASSTLNAAGMGYVPFSMEAYVFFYAERCGNLSAPF
jgi:hypothetical protein